MSWFKSKKVPPQFKPQEDITAYELAVLLPFILSKGWSHSEMVKVLKLLPDHVKRHVKFGDEE